MNQRLLNIYPRELSELELKKVKEDEMKDELNDAFLKMYDLTEEGIKNKPDETK